MPEQVKYDLEYFREQVKILAAKIDAPASLFPNFGYVFNSGKAYVHIDEKGSLYYVIPGDREPDVEIFAVDANDLLYRIFNGIIMNMSMDYELKHRIPGQDTRILWFEKEKEFLGILNPLWKKRKEAEQYSILTHSPYNK